MSETILDHHDLEAYLPHRGVNLIPDTVTIQEGGQTAISRTTVDLDDPRGRDLLSRSGGPGHVWYEPFLAELMALTGVPLLHELLSPQNQVAVFSTISNIQFPHEAILGQTLVGEATITRQRSGFTQFGATLMQGDNTIFTADIMSGAATLEEISSQPVRGGEVDNGNRPDAFGWKDAGLAFIDGITQTDAGAGTLQAIYRYPEDHHFVPGHFPGAPLMMGVTQWAAVLDAGWAAAQIFDWNGKIAVTGKISRPDGSEVMSVRQAVIEARGDHPAVLSTKRVAFREPVRPGDQLLISVEVARC